MLPGQTYVFRPAGGPIVVPGRPAAPARLDLALLTAADDGINLRPLTSTVSLTATPEPSTIALAGAGILLLGAWTRRRKNAPPVCGAQTAGAR